MKAAFLPQGSIFILPRYSFCFTFRLKCVVIPKPSVIDDKPSPCAAFFHSGGRLSPGFTFRADSRPNV